MRVQSLRRTVVLLISSSLSLCSGALIANETETYFVLANDRFVTRVNKGIGYIDYMTLDGQDLLGPRAGSSGVGPYLDCYCIPSGSYTPGSGNTVFKLFHGVDSSHVAYGGVLMSNVYVPTGQLFEQYWFLRDGETGLHTFSRLAYHNSTTPFLRNLQEFRTLFRPTTPLWTHLITDESFYAPLPNPNPATGSTVNATTVQDATWYIGNRTNDAYVEQMADYFTKYTFASTWRDQKAHGLFGDGSQSTDNSTFGAWLVMNTQDTYFGGPLHGDLVVDGILYNYLVSNHWGAGTPNITDGFDRTFGPQYYHFNRGAVGGAWQTLRDEALQAASPAWNADFYDSIAKHVANYVPTSGRGSWKAQVKLPQGAKNAVAVLAQNRVDFQDNVEDPTAYQYWADIVARDSGVQIDRVKAGTYRLTVYADGIFGDYIQDDIVVKAGHVTNGGTVRWTPDSAGTELWRIGTPDKSSGEYRHGAARDPTHPLHPPEHRIYFDAYDFIDDFPQGVNFHVGKSDEARDLNYVHWSVFGGGANFHRPEQVAGHGEINNWTISFDVAAASLARKREATFTVQLAGAKTAAGNTDLFNVSQPYNNVPFVVVVNGNELEPWVIPYYHSSSCGVRSSVVCYQVAHKFTFPTSYLETRTANEIILSLPYNATDYESAMLPTSIYVQYDALRLEVK